MEKEGVITVLSNWESVHLKALQRKFEARGLKMIMGSDGRSAVIQGRHWASLEQLKEQVKYDTCLNDDYEAFLE